LLKQKFILHFSAGILGQLITAATGIVVARIAGPEIIGTVAYGAAYVSIFGFGLGLFGSSHMKLVSEGQHHGNCVKTFTVLQTFNILLFVLIFTGWFLFQIFIADHSFQKEQLWVIVIYFVFFVVSQFLNMWQINFSATIEIAKNSIPLLLQNIVYNSTRIIVVLIGLGAIALTASNLTGLLVSVPITLYYIRKLPAGRFDFSLMRKYLSISFVFLIIVVCGTLITNLGRLALERYESVREIGIFTAGNSIASMLLLISTTTGTIFFPLLSKLVSENNYEKINHQIEIFERIILIFLAPAVFVVAIFSTPLIIFLLGRQYELSGIVLNILIITSLIQIVTLPYGNLIAGKGLFKILALISFCQLILFLASLLLFLDHRFLGIGAVGLAWATGISNLFQAICFVVISVKKGSITAPKINYKYYMSSTLLLLVLLSIIHFDYFANRLYLSIIIVFLIISSYYGVLYYLKWIKRDDLNIILDFINPGKLIKYIKSDL